MAEMDRDFPYSLFQQMENLSIARVHQWAVVWEKWKLKKKKKFIDQLTNHLIACGQIIDGN